MPEQPSAEIVIGVKIGVRYWEARVTGPLAVIGRKGSEQDDPPDIDLSQDESVSRRHAEIRRVGDDYVVVDAGSTNGTRLNGQRLEPGQPTRLHDGDHVTLGRLSVLTVRLKGRHAGSAPEI